MTIRKYSHGINCFKSFVQIGFIHLYLGFHFSDKPKIVTSDGHLKIQSAANHNISLETGTGGDVLIGKSSLKRVLSDVSNFLMSIPFLASSYIKVHQARFYDDDNEQIKVSCFQRSYF